MEIVLFSITSCRFFVLANLKLKRKSINTDSSSKLNRLDCSGVIAFYNATNDLYQILRSVWSVESLTTLTMVGATFSASTSLALVEGFEQGFYKQVRTLDMGWAKIGQAMFCRLTAALQRNEHRVVTFDLEAAGLNAAMLGCFASMIGNNTRIATANMRNNHVVRDWRALSKVLRVNRHLRAFAGGAYDWITAIIIVIIIYRCANVGVDVSQGIVIMSANRLLNGRKRWKPMLRFSSGLCRRATTLWCKCSTMR
jgi:hypothetical protein